MGQGGEGGVSSESEDGLKRGEEEEKKGEGKNLALSHA